MDIRSILLTIAICFLYRIFFGKKYVDWVIFFLSIFAIFYYQPISSIKNFDFWVPSISLLMGGLSWVLVSKQSIHSGAHNRLALVSIISIYSIFALLRLFPQFNLLQTISIPSQFNILIFIIFLFSSILILNQVEKKKSLYWVLILILITFFTLQKNEYLSLKTSEFLRKLNNQSVNLSNPNEIVWIGYSYFAFRLIHVLIDSRRSGKMEIGLHEFIGYLFFFPALLAGPIMRAEEYLRELRNDIKDSDEIYETAFIRLSTGLFQKFILADMLAYISINPSNAGKISSPGWMWFFVIMYAFRIFFDFSGYTHIAIGISQLIGINLPENFKQPLRSPNITIFWNNWHITLTQWFRAYYFNPVTRFLRRNYKDINPSVILAFMQISTMVLIGLWHGISWNFISWGFWIGIGLFLQNQSSAWFLKNIPIGKPFWQINVITKAASITATFIYISLGWVWFAMPDLKTSLHVFATLVGK